MKNKNALSDIFENAEISILINKTKFHTTFDCCILAKRGSVVFIYRESGNGPLNVVKCRVRK